MKAEAKPVPKRLIEIDLPIRRISENSRWEKKSVPGHIKQIHLWWARRPLAACRAVACAALWPDPADYHCPQAFRNTAKDQMLDWARKHLDKASEDSFQRFNGIARKPEILNDPFELRGALLDFIGDFSDWANGSQSDFLRVSRRLTLVAHAALFGDGVDAPVVIDPFAGGGSIPIEALRVGANAFANDVNPVATLLNKMAIEFIPRHGSRLATEVRRWGRWVQEEALRRLEDFYPKDEDGAIPIAYLWARTIQCEGPACGAEVPLVRGFWLTKKSNRKAGFRFSTDAKRKSVGFEILEDPKPEQLGEPTVRRGSASCPLCGFTTPIASVRRQLRAKRGGANAAKSICVVRIYSGKQGRFYRLPNENDTKAVAKACEYLEQQKRAHKGPLALVPAEPTPQGGGSGAGRAFSQRNYGMDSFEDIHTTRQLAALTTFADLIRTSDKNFPDVDDPELVVAIKTALALNLTKLVDLSTSLGAWEPNIPTVQHLFGRQAIGMCWDFAEAVPIGQGRGSWSNYLEKLADTIEMQVGQWEQGHVSCRDGSTTLLPDDSAHLFFTDPPYYDAVPYSDLSDLFYVWLRRALTGDHSELLSKELTPKDEECIVDEIKGKDAAFFERKMRDVLANGRSILHPSGIGVVVFAHKTTTGWEAQLQAMIDSGWVITGSWPIDTENASRLRAQSSAALASSIHIVCRPRENPDGSVRSSEVGDWRDVLAELPRRIHEWMPRLAAEGVVGADAIFACLGPALEIFSRYARVEKANGEPVLLKEYLEHVWAAVSKEALSVIFEGASTEGFEPDARLTAMWLWTLAGSAVGDTSNANSADDEEDEKPTKKGKKTGGFSLEYDAARKIAQGLGAHIEDLKHLVELSGETARLLPVAERTSHLFGKAQAEEKLKGRKPKKKDHQLDLFAELADEKATEETWTEKTVSKVGETTLDRVHQSMILFAANRGEALKRFLVEDGAGKDPKFWRLAQALSALYPSQTDEKRWVDGVLARKKGLGL